MSSSMMATISNMSTVSPSIITCSTKQFDSHGILLYKSEASLSIQIRQNYPDPSPLIGDFFTLWFPFGFLLMLLALTGITYNITSLILIVPLIQKCKNELFFAQLSLNFNFNFG